MKTVNIFRAVIAAALLVCFGAAYGNAASAQEAATITLLHGIPGTPVDVVVDGTVLISNFESGKTADLSSSAGQTLTKLEVRPAGGDTPVIGPIDVKVPASGNWTVLAHLDASGTPKLSSFENDTTPTAAGEGRLVVVHAAEAPGVDLVVGTDRPIVNLENGSAKTLDLPVGPISGAKLAPTGGDPIVDVPDVQIVAGDDLIVYAVGSTKSAVTFLTQTIKVGELEPEVSTTTSTVAESTTTSTTTADSTTTSTSTSTTVADTSTSSTSSTTSTTLAPTDAATVTLLHGIPGVAVDVLVDGTVVFANFEGGQTQDLSSFAGQTLTNLEVRAASSDAAATDSPLIGPIDFEVPDSGNWTAVAHLDADGKPTLSAFQNDTSKVETGNGRLVVVHAAAAPAVDLIVGDERPIVNLPNGSVKALVLKAGTISGAKLAPTGGDPVIDVPTVELAAGTDLVVYAVGSLSESTVTFYTQTITVGETTSDSTTSTTTATQVRPVTGSGRTLWLLGAVLLATGLMLATAARQNLRTSNK